MTAQTRKLSDAPDENLLARLRVLERKMGLVLTLVGMISRTAFLH
jgi:DASH complex subunit DAD3